MRGTINDDGVIIEVFAKRLAVSCSTDHFHMIFEGTDPEY